MMAGPSEYIETVRRAGGFGLHVTSDALRTAFAYFDMPTGYSAFYEEQNAGHISPRRLVAAQTISFERHGGRVIDAVVNGIDEHIDGVRISAGTDTITADRVLVAAGYFTDMLLDRIQHLDVYARTVAFFEIDSAEIARLAKMPSLIWKAPEDPYLLPPIKYPDGKTYIKLGGDPTDEALHGKEEIHDWFRSGGNAAVRDRLEEMIRDLMPDLDIKSVSMEACVTSWTKDRYPEIRRLTDRISVCTGGNGAGAKCSDELGRRGAALASEKIGEFV